MAIPKILAIAPQRCPVCGDGKLRPHRVTRLPPVPEVESGHYICAQGHVFPITPLNDPLLERACERISRTQAAIAFSRRLVAQFQNLLAETRRNGWTRR